MPCTHTGCPAYTRVDFGVSINASLSCYQPWLNAYTHIDLPHTTSYISTWTFCTVNPTAGKLNFTHSPFNLVNMAIPDSLYSARLQGITVVVFIKSCARLSNDARGWVSRVVWWIQLPWFPAGARCRGNRVLCHKIILAIYLICLGRNCFTKEIYWVGMCATL